ncbi:MAG TPA: hypothetical protein VLA92_04110 [Candidatus Saccharimonadales bacterium]|nr:hypothetical protein [Candidatus Saccharimonadales bacterium]
MSRNKKLAIALIALIIAILGVVAFAVGNDDKKTDTKDNKKSAKVESKNDEAKTGENKGEVEGATIVTEGSSNYTTPVNKPSTSVKTSGVTTVANSSQPTAPANNTPSVPTQENPTVPEDETPTEPVSCFVQGEGTFFVPRGGNSPSYTFEFETPVLWWGFGENVDTSDAGTNVKSGFPAFIVIENENFDPTVPTDSITFHLHAREDAPLGNYCPEIEFAEIGLAAVDPETFMTLASEIFDITVVDPTAVAL